MKFNLKSTRFRVYFTLFLAIIFLPFLFNYSMSQSNQPNNGVFIPVDHQTNRFEYLDIPNLDHIWTPNNLQITGTLHNTSYIYNLIDIQLEFILYADEKATEFISTYKHTIESIDAGADYDLLINIERDGSVESWRMNVTNLTLAQK